MLRSLRWDLGDLGDWEVGPWMEESHGEDTLAGSRDQNENCVSHQILGIGREWCRCLLSCVAGAW